MSENSEITTGKEQLEFKKIKAIFQVSQSAFPRVKNLHTRKTSNGSNFGWLIQQMSINQKVGGRRFLEGLYQALFSFRHARRNVIYKAKRK